MWTVIIMKNMQLLWCRGRLMTGQCLKHALKTRIVHVVASATVWTSHRIPYHVNVSFNDVMIIYRSSEHCLVGYPTVGFPPAPGTEENVRSFQLPHEPPIRLWSMVLRRTLLNDVIFSEQRMLWLFQGAIVYCKIAYRDFFICQKVNWNVSHSPRKPGNQTAPNSDNLGESYGRLNSGSLARVE